MTKRTLPYLIAAFVIIGIASFLKFGFGPASHDEALPATGSLTDTASLMPPVLEQQANPSVSEQAVAMSSESVPTNTGSGLITFAVQPSFSKELPSFEAQSNAWVMNEKFKQLHGQLETN